MRNSSQQRRQPQQEEDDFDVIDVPVIEGEDEQVQPQQSAAQHERDREIARRAAMEKQR